MKFKFFFLGIVASFSAFYLIHSCNPKTEENVSDAYKDNLITYKQGQVLYNNYTDSNYKIINEARATDQPDSRAYWYSIEELEGYINYVKTEGAKKGYKNLGIRIYMGEYPENENFDTRLNDKYRGYQTIYFIPTQKDEGMQKSAQNLRQATAIDSNGNKDITDLNGMDLSHVQPPY